MAYTNLDIDCKHFAINGEEVEATASQLSAAGVAVLTIPVEDLSADGDITARPVFVAPFDLKVLDVSIVSTGSASGLSTTDTAVVKLANASAEVAGDTFKTVASFPGAGVAKSLTLDKVNVDKGDVLTLSVTTGTQADLPAFLLQVTYQMGVS